MRVSIPLHPRHIVSSERQARQLFVNAEKEARRAPRREFDPAMRARHNLSSRQEFRLPEKSRRRAHSNECRRRAGDIGRGDAVELGQRDCLRGGASGISNATQYDK
jgi:hypothetical protein